MIWSEKIPYFTEGRKVWNFEFYDFTEYESRLNNSTKKYGSESVIDEDDDEWDDVGEDDDTNESLKTNWL